MEVNVVLMTLLALVAAPLLGGLLFGIDRKLSARMQGRMGPPILQPFYDLFKLFGKSRMVCNGNQMICASVYLAANILSLLMLVFGQDLLVLLFILALGSVALVLGGYSVKSPYSQLGSQRELLQMLAYEPLLVFMVVGAYMVFEREVGSGTFLASNVTRLSQPLVCFLPVFVLTQTVVLAVKLHKSPFDLAGSHHAHQELVRGIYTEFSGTQLAIIELGHYYEVVLLLAFIAMLGVWQAPPLASAAVGAGMALACYFAVIVLDNVAARLTWDWVVKFAWSFGAGAALVNLAVLYVQ